ncbi:MAG: tRNA (adenosine(37)-N6)-threonylcarbamoyltransferase complex ATPase subunit type 1 TsaE [Candidatus Staskawiczbacteria bacterium]|nr:tRNA (adenosine(37)-N6)-threonylcarbamoyltransferase complex ATPase subunit type 1 TsaE [Candidatus Staskawiczbacteria bacterium]
MQVNYLTKNSKQTQKLGEKIALQLRSGQAVVLALQGDLGSGKTTFLQGFAKGLGIKEKILSPTFIIVKRFKLRNYNFKNFYHIDCYRIKNYKDLDKLGFKDIIASPENIVAVEWPEKIKKILPKSTITIEFDFIDKNKRRITINF